MLFSEVLEIWDILWPGQLQLKTPYPPLSIKPRAVAQQAGGGTPPRSSAAPLLRISRGGYPLLGFSAAARRWAACAFIFIYHHLYTYVNMYTSNHFTSLVRSRVVLYVKSCEIMWNHVKSCEILIPWYTRSRLVKTLKHNETHSTSLNDIESHWSIVGSWKMLKYVKRC